MNAPCNTLVIGWTSGELDLLTNTIRQTQQFKPGRILLSDPLQSIEHMFLGRGNLIIFRLSDCIHLPTRIEVYMLKRGCIYCTVTPI